MKTSNKLIIGFAISFFLGAIAIHGLLYNEYRKGHFVSAEQMTAERFTRIPLPAPKVISFEGTIWVNLSPADTFALDIPRNNEDPDAGMFEKTALPITRSTNPLQQGNLAGGKAITWLQRGDTLFVIGTTMTPIHRPFTGWPYRSNIPQVTVHTSAPGEVLLNNGQIYLQGTNDSSILRKARLNIRNSTLWIGMHYETRRDGPTEYFDSVDLRAQNSIIVLNTAAYIRHLQASLTDSSVITDQYARLINSVIHSSPDSRVDLSGDALKNNQVIIH